MRLSVHLLYGFTHRMLETLLHIGSGSAVGIVLVMSTTLAAGLRRDVRIDPVGNAPFKKLIRWMTSLAAGMLILIIGLSYHFSLFYLLAIVPSVLFALPAELENRERFPLVEWLSQFESEAKAVGIAVLTIATLFLGVLSINGLKSVESLTQSCMDRSSYTQRVGALCGDGSYSYATGSGACSWHGGVEEWDRETVHRRSLSDCQAYARKESWRD